MSSPPSLPARVVTAPTELSQPSDLVSRHFGRNLYLTERPHCVWPVLISIRDVWTKVFCRLKAQYVRTSLLLNSSGEKHISWELLPLQQDGSVRSVVSSPSLSLSKFHSYVLLLSSL